MDEEVKVTTADPVVMERREAIAALRKILRGLDKRQERLAGIYVAQAIDTLGRSRKGSMASVARGRIEPRRSSRKPKAKAPDGPTMLEPHSARVDICG